MNIFNHPVNGFGDNSLHFIIQPTSNCNCRCSCCNDVRVNTYITSNVLANIKKYIRGRADDLQNIHISWFGGEPLLASEAIFELSAFLSEISYSRPALSVSQDITTNGTLLTESLLNKLIEHHITDFHIALDGFREHHDITRPHSLSFVSAFDLININLMKMKESRHNFRVLLKCHLTSLNKQAYPDFVRWVDSSFLDDRRFFVRLLPANCRGEELSDFSCEDKDVGIFNKVKELITHKNNIFNLPEGHMCYASCSNSFTVAPDGTIGKCTASPFEGINNLGKITDEGEMVIDDEKLKLWLKPLSNGVLHFDPCPCRSIFDSVSA